MIDPVEYAGNSLQISVIIAAYNAGSTIGETLESLLAQKHTYWEAIVVDDGSIDHTGEIVQKFIARDLRIRMIRQANGGEAAARNAGLPLARYDWLLFLDADDWISPFHLQKMTEELMAHPDYDAVHCGSARVAPDGTQIVEKYQPPYGDLFSVLARRAAFPVHACVVRKSTVRSVGDFDTSFIKCPDWDLWQRVARTGARFGAIRDVLALYRMSPNAASLDASQMLKDGLRVLKQGHAPDPRVKNPHPEHAMGEPDDGIRTQEFYLLCWCAGLQLGTGADARFLIDFLKEERFPELYPQAVAQCIFDSAPLPECQPIQNWENLANRILTNTDAFMMALEKQSDAPNLAKQAGAELRKMILQQSPKWQPVIESYEKTIQKKQQEIGKYKEAHQKQEEVIEEFRRWTTNLENERIRLENERIRLENERIRLEAEQIRLEAEKNELVHCIDELEIKGQALEQLGNERALQIQAHLARIADLENDRSHWQRLATHNKERLDYFRRHLLVRIGKRLHLVNKEEQTFLRLKLLKRRYRAVAVSVILLSVLQGLYFLLSGALTVYHSFAIAVSIANLVICVSLLRTERIRLFALSLFLYAAQVGFLSYELMYSGFGSAPRLLIVSVILFHFAIFLSLLLGETGILRRKAVTR